MGGWQSVRCHLTVFRSRGLTLNEYGMGEKWSAADQNPNGFRPGTLRVVESEREIFEILGFPAVRLAYPSSASETDKAILLIARAPSTRLLGLETHL